MNKHRFVKMDREKSVDGAVTPETARKQKRLGPAPIASFEDISDEIRHKVCSFLDLNF